VEYLSGLKRTDLHTWRGSGHSLFILTGGAHRKAVEERSFSLGHKCTAEERSSSPGYCRGEKLITRIL
jgi:hypothetical protein